MQSFCYVVLLQWLLCRRTSDIVHRSDAKPITWKCSFIDAHAPHAPRRVLHAAPCCSVQRGVYVTVCKYCLNLVLHYYIWLAFVEGQIELGAGSCAEWVEFRPDADANADSDSDEARSGEWGGCGVWEINNLYANFAFAMREKPMNMKMFSFSLPAYNPSAIRHLNPHTHTHTHTFSISKQWGNWKQNMMMFDWQIFHAAVVESKPESESEGTKLFPSSSAHRPPFKYLAWPAGRN